MSHNESVLVIDFGSPYNQLLTRSIRELGIYSELRPHTISVDEVKVLQPKGIILSGGPYYIHDQHRYRIDENIFTLGIPILGICYGAQLITDHFGGKVTHHADRSYEAGTIKVQNKAGLFSELDKEQVVYMSKGDTISELPEKFEVDATDVAGDIAAFSNESEKMYGVQFYPEKQESEHGVKLLKNFLFTISGCTGEWSIERFIDTEIANIKAEVGDKKVLCALSGGVDSSVVAALIHKAIGDQLTCIFVDHGLLRKNEANEVMELLADDFHMNIIQVDAADRFLSKLTGVDDPEEKRKIIGNEFIAVFDEEAAKLTDVDYLAQGTLYSDVIESGTETGQKVKSHHNVGGLPEDMEFKLIEPIRSLFKDEVRKLGTALGLPDHIVWRQPFPGPGLGIRVLGEVTREKLTIVREADAILREEIALAGLDRDIWQYFAILPNIRSVGVRDDARSYDYTVGLRAVHSVDGMTSDWARIDWEILDKISHRIVAEVDHVNRVVYDITSKPPATIEWE
ncbi:glutamine-hydrolyzing GMP synthase [Pseudogracilibacillus auburnensis]|uniref:GMP synthase [glutamine-hydrolyzing] n=1 Tax=Pseudogracilibacillus auburnensis TaxID=1494959 RepID=A0A2V3W7U0_9BACI|nr:glutamine-hydrolyzing GMP synthase [Pseudogracilibacillus auburnensis]PXW90407.1 GMP synthase (glutamine-hydrolysing) [Pseudogracilibacillus auburnensis]